MVANPTPARAQLALVPRSAPVLGPMIRAYRVRAGLSQNSLAKLAGVDPAYVNRLERDVDGTGNKPSRNVVLGLWGVLRDETAGLGDLPGPIGATDRDRLLAAAGLVPEVVLEAGGWDAYCERLRAIVLGGLTATLNAFDAAQMPADE
jgi:transcriptional regulator with XRE-family HTH domain